MFYPPNSGIGEHRAYRKLNSKLRIGIVAVKYLIVKQNDDNEDPP